MVCRWPYCHLVRVAIWAWWRALRLGSLFSRSGRRASESLWHDFVVGIPVSLGIIVVAGILSRGDWFPFVVVAVATVTTWIGSLILVFLFYLLRTAVRRSDNEEWGAVLYLHKDDQSRITFVLFSKHQQMQILHGVRCTVTDPIGASSQAVRTTSGVTVERQWRYPDEFSPARGLSAGRYHVLWEESVAGKWHELLARSDVLRLPITESTPYWYGYPPTTR